MYALKYGTAPIVRATGGLRDTVTEFDPKTGAGNGFVFEPYHTEDLVAALNRMLAAFKTHHWRKLMANGFEADFSWERSAHDYMEWFERLHRERRAAFSIQAR
jgi:starch synthase